ncbi:MAG: putative prolin-rich exported protein [Proteobacteria bacterium]|nr:putative prolin-rich exported protein [Pseudomonadota bacterium]
MHMPLLHPRLRGLLFGIAALVLSTGAMAEPPSRAARLSYISGTVSFSPAGDPDWVQATVNRPLTTGDRLWADTNSRAELQIGGAAIRMGAATSVTLLNLDNRMAQMRLAQGTLKVRVRHMGANQVFEVNTPNVAFTLRRPGEYRIDVDPNDDATAVMVQSGRAEVYGEGASYAVSPQQGYRFYGTGLSDYELLAARRDDDLDRWARERDRRGDNSASARYVSSEVVGYEDLDANGTWRSDSEYGNVWTPTRVAAGWTPYHDGHWAWVDPWGWTWVDDAPWGFAVSHYGRWAKIRGAWGWVPGPSREPAVYAPALVAFVGGKNIQVSVAIGSPPAAVVGWFPLAPREVYQPSYPVSRGYFDNINRSNAVIAPTTITKVYNTTNVINNTTIVNNNINVTKVVYANQHVTGALVAVPAQAFVQSQSVAKTAVKISKEAVARAPVGNVATVAPVQQSVHGGAPTAGAKPPAREQAVVARTAPPPPPVAFAIQQQQLAAKPGTPIDEVQRKQLKPATAPSPTVSVVTTAQATAPTAPPPATPPAGKSPEARKADAAKGAAGKEDAAKAEASRAEAAQADAAKANALKAEAAKTSAAKAEASRAEAAQADATKTNTLKAEAARAAAAKADASRAEAAQADATKTNTLKAEAAKTSAAKAEASRAEAAQADATKTNTLKAEAAKTSAAKAEASRAEAAQANAAKADALKAEAARAAAAKGEASRAEAAQANAAKADALKTEAARAAAAKADASRAEAAQANAAKADALKQPRPTHHGPRRRRPMPPKPMPP